MDKKPLSITDETFMDVVEELLERGERDRLGGGVAPATIADHLDVHRESAKIHCQRLEDSGVLVEVTGVPQSSSRPRVSYLPSYHEDVPDDEQMLKNYPGHENEPRKNTYVGGDRS